MFSPLLLGPGLTAGSGAGTGTGTAGAGSAPGAVPFVSDPTGAVDVSTGAGAVSAGVVTVGTLGFVPVPESVVLSVPGAWYAFGSDDFGVTHSPF